MTKPADFLVELGTEELPPKALQRLRVSFAEGMADGLHENRLNHGAIQSFASPRRLAVLVQDLAIGQEPRQFTQKGPPVKVAFDQAGDPTKAALAFAGKCGVDVADLAREKSAGGEWLVHTGTDVGQNAEQLLPKIVQYALENLPIPRRMRWGAGDTEFVRPVHWLVMLHGTSVVKGSVLGLVAGDESRGHRFHAPGPLKIPAPDQYADTLRNHGSVVVDFDIRKTQILHDVKEAALAVGGEPVGDDALYDEVTALTEWPVVITGKFDESYLELPPEVIVQTLTSHQRYFPVRGADNNLLPAFVTVANLASADPQRVREGNERVIRPRLADAVFFWQTDLSVPLGEKSAGLANVVYQQGLGSLQDKSARLVKLGQFIATAAEVDTAAVLRAAELCKCDLLTGMVGEFPELQGIMGGYYAARGGEAPQVSDAIREHYMPRFAGDDLPQSAAGQVLALADKLDTIAGAFVLGKKPSGNRDPFGLRRAALGVIRIVIEHDIDIDLNAVLERVVALQPVSIADSEGTVSDIYEFVIDRLQHYLVGEESEQSKNVFVAVRSRRPTSLLDFQARLNAVAEFMGLEAAESLAAASKRTANILRKANHTDGDIDTDLVSEDAERNLLAAMVLARNDTAPMIERRDYTDAMQRLADLRQPVDAFFDDVMVMDDDEAIRNNRLALLTELRSLFLGIADISRLTPAQD